MSGAVIAAGIARARRRIESHFEEASATAPERAIAYPPAHRPLARRVFAQLTRFGAVVETKPGHYYLDRERLADYRSTRRRRAATMLAVAAAALGAAIAFG